MEIEILNANIDLLGVVVATVANIVVGMLWFGPLMGAKWMALVGKTKDQLEAKPMDYAYSILIGFTTALFLAFFIYYAGVAGGVGELIKQAPDFNGILYGTANKYVGATIVALMVWVGFVVTSSANLVVWEGRNKMLFLLNIAHHLLSLVVMALVYALFIEA